MRSERIHHSSTKDRDGRITIDFLNFVQHILARLLRPLTFPLSPECGGEGRSEWELNASVVAFPRCGLSYSARDEDL